MKIKYFIIPALLLLTGCIGVNRQFSEVKDKILGKFGNDFKTEFQFSVGSALINISSLVVGLEGSHEYIDNMMREISSVQVGVYNRIQNSNAKADFTILRAIDEEMSGNGLKYIVRTVQNDELTAIYVNNNSEETLHKMYVVNLQDDKLVIVEVNGDLKHVIAYAIEEKNFQKGIFPGSIFLLNSETGTLLTRFTNLSPTAKNDIVIKYSENQDNFNFQNVLNIQNQLYKNIDTFASAKINKDHFVSRTFGNPFEVNSSSWLTSILIVLLITGGPVILGLGALGSITILVIIIYKRRT